MGRWGLSCHKNLPLSKTEAFVELATGRTGIPHSMSCVDYDTALSYTTSVGNVEGIVSTLYSVY